MVLSLTIETVMPINPKSIDQAAEELANNPEFKKLIDARLNGMTSQQRAAFEQVVTKLHDQFKEMLNEPKTK